MSGAMTDRANRGFQLANLDVGLLADPKFLKLVALVPDEGERACTTLVDARYCDVVVARWETFTGLTAEKAVG